VKIPLPLSLVDLGIHPEAQRARRAARREDQRAEEEAPREDQRAEEEALRAAEGAFYFYSIMLSRLSAMLSSAINMLCAQRR
jgi:hypothetical protein